MSQTLNNERSADRVAEVTAQAVADAADWWQDEERRGTLIGTETLWREAYHRHVATAGDVPERDAGRAWASLASRIVFEGGKATRNEREAAIEAAEFLEGDGSIPAAERSRLMAKIADGANVDRLKLLALLGPGIGYPWMFPRQFWNAVCVGETLHALLAPLDWMPEAHPEPSWFVDQARHAEPAQFLAELGARAEEGSDAARMVDACARYIASMDVDGRDITVTETQTFVEALLQHGLDQGDLDRFRADLLALREALVLLRSFRLYYAAEATFAAAEAVRGDEPPAALASAGRAANIYKRLVVAQQYPERLLARYQYLCREVEETRRTEGLPDERLDHVLLVSTFNSPGDLQRLLLSVAHELMAFGYGRTVHVIVSDDSSASVVEQNRRVIDNYRRAGMSISHWDLEQKNAYLDRLNREVFPNGEFDVHDLAGVRKPGEKGVPYGRFRNFLRLVALKEVGELGLDDPILTWLDQDNEIGALVLTKAGKLSKRHVFNYFEQKSTLFEDNADLRVAGGGYTNDALEGVEKFWVAWGILHHVFDLAQHNPPDGPPALPADADITKFRPWDQPNTLERLPREGENVETLADQVLLLLSTLVGTFRGKYDNQVQIYHPWTYGYVNPDDDQLVEESRAFAGMPGGNTTFNREILRSPIPFITVGGRGEDIFHLWQLEAGLGVGSVRLTHTPALHTRNVGSGRSDLMAEIIDSYNGRILREPPLLWRSLVKLFAGDATGADADALSETAAFVDNLRNEAKSRIAEVSGFAAALEPYIDDTAGFWWVQLGREDPRFAEVLGELRSTVGDFKDAARYQALADERLLTADDVRELTDEFMTAYPRWKAVVEHVAGAEALETSAAAAAVSPFPGYGAHERAASATSSPTAWREATALTAGMAEPQGDPAWQEVYESALALHRRSEIGRAERDAALDWEGRVERLRLGYQHYVAQLGDVPELVWARLFRDALLIPGSPAYLALTQLLADDVWRLGHRERDAEVARAATAAGADVELLRLAIAG